MSQICAVIDSNFSTRCEGQGTLEVDAGGVNQNCDFVRLMEDTLGASSAFVDLHLEN